MWKIKADNLLDRPPARECALSVLRVGPINFATYGWLDCSMLLAVAPGPNGRGHSIPFSVEPLEYHKVCVQTPLEDFVG